MSPSNTTTPQNLLPHHWAELQASGIAADVAALNVASFGPGTDRHWEHERSELVRFKRLRAGHLSEALTALDRRYRHLQAGGWRTLSDTLLGGPVPVFDQWKAAAPRAKGKRDERDPLPAVRNAFSPERSNLRGTIAMAKVETSPDSATSQWFWSLADNSAILKPQNGGFKVFGRVLGASDLATLDAMAAVRVFDASNALGPVFKQLPLSNGNLSIDNLLRFSSITTDQRAELSYAVVANSAPNLLEAKVVGGQLRLRSLANRTNRSRSPSGPPTCWGKPWTRPCRCSWRSARSPPKPKSRASTTPLAPPLHFPGADRLQYVVGGRADDRVEHFDPSRDRIELWGLTPGTMPSLSLHSDGTSTQLTWESNRVSLSGGSLPAPSPGCLPSWIVVV